MAKLVRVARDESAVIIQKSDGWYSVVDSKSNVLGSADSLDALVATGAWRKPIKSDPDKFVSMTAALNPETSPTRAVRVPNDVKEKIRDAIKVEPNKRNIPFLLQFTSKETVTVNDVTRLHGIISEAKRHAQVYTTTETLDWVNKVTNPEPLTAAASFEPSNELQYYGVSDKEDSTEINDLYALNDEADLLHWTGTEFVEEGTPADEFEAPTVIQIDEETAEALANWIEDGREGGYLDVASLDEEEFALVSSAMAELDLEELDRLTAIIADATGYSPVERSVNAERQVRGGDGKFAGEQKEQGEELTAFNKARLPQEREVILDPAKRIEEYVAAVRNQQAPSEEAAVEDEDAPAPLYVAVVDEVDRTAVLDMVAIQVDGEDTKAFVRQNKEWVESIEFLDQLRSVTPPAVVELDDEALIKEILAQVDASDDDNVRADQEPDRAEEEPLEASAAEFKDFSKDKREELAKKGWALADGSFPIESENDLKNAVQAYGRAKEENKSKVRTHIRKRARALNRPDLIPSDWKESAISDIVSEMDEQSPLYDPFGVITAAGIPGIIDTPSDLRATNRLRRYWAWGKGAAKIRWGTPGDLTRCHGYLSKYMPGRAWGYCQERHNQRFGFYNPESGGR